MFLESLVAHAPHSKTLKELPWVGPRVITNELLVQHHQGIKNHTLAHELALLWRYSFAEKNLNYVQEHPTAFLQMYAALEQKNEHPLKDANHFDNPLLNTKWHHVFLLGCLRHAFEHRINVKEYEGLKPLTSIIHAQLVELYSMFANPETKASLDEELLCEECDGPDLYVGLSEYAYALLDTLRTKSTPSVIFDNFSA